MTSPVAAASEGMASLRMNPAALPFTRPSHDARSGRQGGGWGHAPLVAAALIFQQGAQGHLAGSGAATPPAPSSEESGLDPRGTGELRPSGSTELVANGQRGGSEGLERLGPAKGGGHLGLGSEGREGAAPRNSDSRLQPAVALTSQRSKFQLSPEVPEFVPVSQLVGTHQLAHSEIARGDSAVHTGVNAVTAAATASLSSTAPTFSPSYLADKASGTLSVHQTPAISCEVVGTGGVTATITVSITGAGTGTITGSLTGASHASQGAQVSLQVPHLSAMASTSTGVVRGSVPFADLSWKQPTTALSYTSPSFTPASLAKSTLSLGPGAVAEIGASQVRGAASHAQSSHSVSGLAQGFSPSLKNHSPVPGLSASLSISAPTFTPSSPASSPAPAAVNSLSIRAPTFVPSSGSLTPTFVPSSGSLPTTPSGASGPAPTTPSAASGPGREREAVRRVQNAEEQASVGALAGGVSGGQLTGDSSRLSPTAPVFMPSMPSSTIGALALQSALTASAGSSSSATSTAAVVYSSRAPGQSSRGVHGAATAGGRANRPGAASLAAPQGSAAAGREGQGLGSSSVPAAAAPRGTAALSRGSAGASGVTVLDRGMGFVPQVPASFLSPSAPAFTPGAPARSAGQGGAEAGESNTAGGAFASSDLAAIAAAKAEGGLPGALEGSSLGMGVGDGAEEMRGAGEPGVEEIELPAELELFPDFDLLHNIEDDPLSQEAIEPSDLEPSALGAAGLGDLSIWTRRAVSQNSGQGPEESLHDHSVWGAGRTRGLGATEGTGGLGGEACGHYEGAAGARVEGAYGPVAGDTVWLLNASNGEGAGHVLERSASDPALGSVVGAGVGEGEEGERGVPSKSATGHDTAATGRASWQHGGQVGQLSAAAKEFVPTQLALGVAGSCTVPALGAGVAREEAAGATTRFPSGPARNVIAPSPFSPLSSASVHVSTSASASASTSSSSPSPGALPSSPSAPASSSCAPSSSPASSSSALDPLDSFRFSWSGTPSSAAWTSPSPAPVHASLPLHFSLPTLWAGTTTALPGVPGMMGPRAQGVGAGATGPRGTGQIETEFAPAYDSGTAGEGVRRAVPSQGLAGEGLGQPSGASFPAISMTRLAELIMSADAEVAAQSPKAHELTEIDLLLPPDLLDPSPPKPVEDATGGAEEGGAPLGAQGLLAEESRRLSFAVQ